MKLSCGCVISPADIVEIRVTQWSTTVRTYNGIAHALFPDHEVNAPTGACRKEPDAPKSRA